MPAIYAIALNVTTVVVLIAGGIAVTLASVIGVAYLIAWTADAWRWRTIPEEGRAYAAANIAVLQKMLQYAEGRRHPAHPRHHRARTHGGGQPSQDIPTPLQRPQMGGRLQSRPGRRHRGVRR